MNQPEKAAFWQGASPDLRSMRLKTAINDLQNFICVATIEIIDAAGVLIGRATKLPNDPANLAKLKDCGVTLLDAPAEVMATALNYLGLDPNSESPDDLKKAGGKWDWATLDHWLKSPKAMAAGTKMTFAGISDAQERANVIAYLNTLGSNLPMPAAPAADAAAPADAAASAAVRVAGGARAAFCCTRPPGHHAGPDFMGGYCFLNNASALYQKQISSS